MRTMPRNMQRHQSHGSFVAIKRRQAESDQPDAKHQGNGDNHAGKCLIPGDSLSNPYIHAVRDYPAAAVVADRVPIRPRCSARRINDQPTTTPTPKPAPITDSGPLT